ncbi:MAG: hypothetical protein E6K78_08240 [Candidatus Eisenbacteria bacterium]|uniref:BPL/LPL catalytic domain-containing protein n=1 Tax=Eiseniibacteriota bacterium TaxID=2212470 RepID=A0A538TNB0_UNCEI|nr:MAG: hypothetical protein E6K78_08240 [Candidatus Eisenbacteria bacterium]
MWRDTRLLARAHRGGEPVLRLFGFRPPSITLGRSQSPEGELDLARCVEDAIPWAVRPTGGRAVFHDQEWTFSLTAALDDASWGGPPGRAYTRTCALIVASLERLSVPATFATGARSARARAGPGGHAALPCFGSTARHEVVLRGRKLVGIAQRRTARALIQQGSLLLGDGHARLPDYQALPSEERARARRTLAQSCATAAPWLGADPPFDRWARVLRELLPSATCLDAAAGAFLLTASGDASYTSSVA